MQVLYAQPCQAITILLALRRSIMPASLLACTRKSVHAGAITDALDCLDSESTCMQTATMA
jgi:hypothetical protein